MPSCSRPLRSCGFRRPQFARTNGVRRRPIAWKGDAVSKLEEDLGIIREAEDEVAQYMTVNNIPTRRRNPD